MPTNHTVQLGDCMSSLAAQYGFGSHTRIYDDAANQDLKKKRPNPNVLAAGDVVVVPDKAKKELDAATGKEHPFKVKLPRAVLRIVLQEEFAGLSGKKYKLTVGKAVFEGKTPGDGKIEHPIPLDAKKGTLELWTNEAVDGYLFDLDIGSLEHESVIGACQARLLNLGWACGGTGGTLDDRTKDALKAFQKKASITQSGALDDATKNKLRTEHEGA